MTRLSVDGLKEYARELGFDLCGVTAAGPAQTHARYAEWLARGYHAQMNYMARPDAIARRRDVRELAPGAKSLVVVATNYYAPSPSPSAAGQVARYAWAADYHHVIVDKLEQLAAWIKRNQVSGRNQVSHQVCVDTRAILEREWAARAGLGWIGKNTCLINPRLGSWLLLGELVLDLELEPDPPFAADRCGACTRCIQACPTGCILPGRLLDASRCISYLTIESRHDVPAELKESVGQWIFGCDVCQQVCPWNRFARPSANIRVNPEWASLDPTEIKDMDEAAFRARFADSAILRPKLAGLKRNAALVIENARAGGKVSMV